MSTGVLTWGSVAIAVGGLVLHGWAKNGREGERTTSLYVGGLVALAFTCSALFFGVMSSVTP